MNSKESPNPLRGEPPRRFHRRYRPSAASRYALAFLATLLAAAIVGAIDLAFSFPPFLVFALAAGVIWLFCGAGPALLSIALAALGSDYFFLQPRYELSLDFATAQLAGIYMVCALLARAGAYWTRQRES